MAVRRGERLAEVGRVGVLHVLDVHCGGGDAAEMTTGVARMSRATQRRGESVSAFTTRLAQAPGYRVTVVTDTATGRQR